MLPEIGIPDANVALAGAILATGTAAFTPITILWARRYFPLRRVFEPRWGFAHVGLVVFAVAAPYAGLGRDVEDNVTSLTSISDGCGVSDVTTNGLDAHGGQFRVVAPGEAAHLMSLGEQLFDDRPPEETASASHQA